MKKSEKPDYITSCMFTWEKSGLFWDDEIVSVVTRVFQTEIHVRYFNNNGLINGKIYPMSDQQRQELFDLLDICRFEWDKDDYSVKSDNDTHWQIKICTKNVRCFRSVGGTGELPPHGNEIKELLENIIGNDVCYIF